MVQYNSNTVPPVAGLFWRGSRVTTTTNPQRLLEASPSRVGWRVVNISGAVGALGYSAVPEAACIALAFGGNPVAAWLADPPVETNEIWYHGPIGAVLGVAEAV